MYDDGGLSLDPPYQTLLVYTKWGIQTFFGSALYALCHWTNKSRLWNYYRLVYDDGGLYATYAIQKLLVFIEYADPCVSEFSLYTYRLLEGIAGGNRIQNQERRGANGSMT